MPVTGGFMILRPLSLRWAASVAGWRKVFPARHGQRPARPPALPAWLNIERHAQCLGVVNNVVLSASLSTALPAFNLTVLLDTDGGTGTGCLYGRHPELIIVPTRAVIPIFDAWKGWAWHRATGPLWDDIDASATSTWNVGDHARGRGHGLYAHWQPAGNLSGHF